MDLVSQYETAHDKLSFKVLRPDVFVSDDKKRAIPTSNTKIEVPTFVQPEYFVATVSHKMSTTFANTVKTIMASNFAISILFATALQRLWTMVNALQIIVLAGLFQI